MFSDFLRLLRVAVLLGAVSVAPVSSGWGQGRVTVVPAPERESSSRQEPASDAAAQPRSANYRLSPGDAVAVKVFREANLDISQRLSKDGTINFPLLGFVRLAGRTTNEAATMIGSMLDKDYIVHPQVSVSIVTYIKQKYTVLGQVGSPGSYEIPDEQTVDILTAIAKAGGFTRLANPAKVTVRRVTEGHEEVFSLDAKRLMNDTTSSRFYIQPNDTISVAERFL